MGCIPDCKLTIVRVPDGVDIEHFQTLLNPPGASGNIPSFLTVFESIRIDPILKLTPPLACWER
jgi:hypothetical protein